MFNGSGYSNPGTRVLEGKNTYSKPGFGPKNPGICKSGIFEAFFKLFLMKSTKKDVFFIHLYISLKARANFFGGVAYVVGYVVWAFPPVFYSTEYCKVKPEPARVPGFWLNFGLETRV